MDEDSKKVLYKQLVEMYENNNKKDKQPTITENEYLQLSAKDALTYILNYRENADFGLDDKGQKNIFYIELPNMDLSGEDLRNLRIKEFIPGTIDENGIFTASCIVLQNTNALIDVNDIGYTRSEENERGTTNYIIDFELMNFNGCDIYGILPDEYAEYEDEPKSKLKSKIITQNKEGHLDERYLQRRKEEHLSKEEKARSDKAYKRIMSGNSVKGMKGVNDGTINLNDYDFSELNDEQIEALKLSVENYNIETNDIELIDRADYFSHLSYNEREKILEHALKFRNMNFVEKKFKYLNSDFKETVLITKLEENDTEYIEEHFKYLHYSDKTKIVKKALELDKIEFVEKHFEHLSGVDREEVVEKALELNKMKFIEEHFKHLTANSQEIILIKKIEHNDIKYVEKHFKDLYSRNKEMIVEKALELEKIDFVEKYFGYIDIYARKSIIEKALELNKMYFVEKHFEDISNELKKLIVEKALELNKMGFVEKYFEYLSSDSREAILIKKIEQDDMEYVEKHFEDLSSDSKETVLITKLKENDTDYIEKHFKHLKWYEKTKIVKNALELDKIEFVEKYFEHLESYEKKEIVKKALELDKIEFVEKHFKDLDYETQEKLLCKIKNPKKYIKLIYDLVNDEKRQIEFIGKKQQSCSGRLVYKALSQEKINEELIKELIKAGSNPNYVDFKNEKTNGCNQVMYTPVLIKALEIKDKEQKNRIIRTLIEAGVDVNAEKLELNYYRYGKGPTKRQKAIDDKDLQEILNKKNKEKNEKDISNFLKQELNLSEEEIAKLEETFQNYGNSIYDKSFEELKLQKEILSAVNCEKEGFTDCARILFLKPEVIYSRLKFFTENSIIVEAERLQETLGSTNKAFAKRFGKQILPTQAIDLNDTQYPAELKRELLQKYPMPRKNEELKVELDKVSEKYKGRESD